MSTITRMVLSPGEVPPNTLAQVFLDMTGTDAPAHICPKGRYDPTRIGSFYAVTSAPRRGAFSWLPFNEQN